ncbi:uncharacterized protein LOC122973504 [Thunnus albacares]|uniref:uncharacterized protein LOC122973504 n=1 Tax=Thunnus albacares TaxID=8236 RepID=UPI001CF6FD90|nr:uncharacterized protein LOC122973504 [Thunnus albacares]
MGTNQSKTPKNGWTGDAKCMYTMNEESVQYLDKWKKKYKFKGGLYAEDCKKLCEEIAKACKGDEKREKKEGLLQAYLWLEQAKMSMAQVKQQDDDGTNAVASSVVLHSVVVKQVQDTAPIPGLASSSPPTTQRAPPPYQEGAAAWEQISGIIEGLNRLSLNSPVSQKVQPVPSLYLDLTKLSGEERSATDPPISSRTRQHCDLSQKKLSDLVEPPIELPNPRQGEGQPDSVFCNWTKEDLRKAVDGIPHPRKDVQAYINKIYGLYNSYRLNGEEMTKCLRQSLTTDWATVNVDWRPMGANGEPLLWDRDRTRGLGPQLNQMADTLRETFGRRNDWAEIDTVVQEEKETVAQYAARLMEAFNGHSGLEPRIGDRVNPHYESQLTSRLLRGLKPQIANWIKKHLVGWEGEQRRVILAHAKHAEKVLENRDKKHKNVKVFHNDGENDDGCLSSSESCRKEIICYRCGKRGHIARECRSPMPAADTGRGGGQGGGRGRRGRGGRGGGRREKREHDDREKDEEQDF